MSFPSRQSIYLTVAFFITSTMSQVDKVQPKNMKDVLRRSLMFLCAWPWGDPGQHQERIMSLENDPGITADVLRGCCKLFCSFITSVSMKGIMAMPNSTHKHHTQSNIVAHIHSLTHTQTCTHILPHLYWLFLLAPKLRDIPRWESGPLVGVPGHLF